MRNVVEPLAFRVDHTIRARLQDHDVPVVARKQEFHVDGVGAPAPDAHEVFVQLAERIAQCAQVGVLQQRGARHA